MRAVRPRVPVCSQRGHAPTEGWAGRMARSRAQARRAARDLQTALESAAVAPRSCFRQGASATAAGAHARTGDPMHYRARFETRGELARAFARVMDLSQWDSCVVDLATLTLRFSAPPDAAARVSDLLAVETPVADRLGDVGNVELRLSGEVGDRACDAQHAHVGAHRQAEPLHSVA